ncbi:AraC family transcriptional regulator ligand-binding domain-containing protein [Pendulispora albinea]|uniref:AraC family transcriptional regulator n=1 Tax=Pendulispora albinea TaxID=2741071 RepID=A0ABZ2LTD2_9BACT
MLRNTRSPSSRPPRLRDCNVAQIRSPFLPLLFDWLRNMGVREIVDQVRDELGLSGCQGTLVRTSTAPLPAYRAASELVSCRLRDAYVGLHLVENIPRGSYGLLEFTAQFAPTVGEALGRIARYMPLVTDTCRLDLRRSTSEFALVHRVPGEALCLGRHANEFVLGTLLRIAREGTQTRIRPARIEFAHPEPNDISALVDFFGTRNIHFEAGHNQLVFEDTVFSTPIVSRDERLLPWLDHCANTLLPGAVRDEPVLGLRDEIRKSLEEHGVPTLSSVARGMRIGSRTLQRRLQDAHTSFRDELDEVRRHLAESYLRDPARSIKEIASSLGYSGRGGFERAFRKWYRATPHALRSALVASSI